jgi:DNA uptake protein ComE-like DNA-binding protein
MKKEELRQIFREYFTFNKTERKGFIVLGVILIMVLFASYIADRINFSKPTDFSWAKEFLLELEENQITHPEATWQYLFSFNPNTISGELLDTLDLPLAIKRNIIRYRERGGTFRSIDDVKRIYGMNDSIFAELLSYIDIPVKTIPEKVSSKADEAMPGKFIFDPNTATASELELLGMNAIQRRNLLLYRESGGRFTVKEDLMKIYGVDEVLYNQLEEWIDINQSIATVTNVTAEVRVEQIEINMADSAALLKLPGIGPAFSGRIIRYRNLLGGYVSSQQLMEVFGMTEERFAGFKEYLDVDPALVKLIRINFAEVTELRSHPYINQEQARMIINLRSERGPYDTLDELLQLNIFSESEIKRVKPYITFR